jgi:hypothetical protein
MLLSLAPNTVYNDTPDSDQHRLGHLYDFGMYIIATLIPRLVANRAHQTFAATTTYTPVESTTITTIETATSTSVILKSDILAVRSTLGNPLLKFYP